MRYAVETARGSELTEASPTRTLESWKVLGKYGHHLARRWKKVWASAKAGVSSCAV